MSDEHERPTVPMEPLEKIAKITVDFEDADNAAAFLEFVAKLIKLKQRVTIFVQAE